MDLHEAANYGLIPTYDDLKIGMLKLIEQGKISREDAAFVLPELRESENERIRKEIQEFLRDNCGAGQEAYKKCEEWCYWLEKQKEQKPIFRVGDTMRTWDEAKRGIKDGLPHIISINSTDYLCNNEAIRISEQGDYEFPPMNRQQPAEWSEEDEKMLNKCISQCTVVVPIAGKNGWLHKFETRTDEKRVSWLKQFPGRFNIGIYQLSQEQITLLSDLIEESKGNRRIALIALYKDLQKLWAKSGALTWRDMKLIMDIVDKFIDEKPEEELLKLGENGFYEEVLRRFNERRKK